MKDYNEHVLNGAVVFLVLSLTVLVLVGLYKIGGLP